MKLNNNNKTYLTINRYCIPLSGDLVCTVPSMIFQITSKLLTHKNALPIMDLDQVGAVLEIEKEHKE